MEAPWLSPAPAAAEGAALLLPPAAPPVISASAERGPAVPHPGQDVALGSHHPGGGQRRERVPWAGALHSVRFENHVMDPSSFSRFGVF